MRGLYLIIIVFSICSCSTKNTTPSILGMWDEVGADSLTILISIEKSLRTNGDITDTVNLGIPYEVVDTVGDIVIKITSDSIMFYNGNYKSGNKYGFNKEEGYYFTFDGIRKEIARFEIISKGDNLILSLSGDLYKKR